MASYLTFYDAAWPPSIPPETDGFCCYIGGDTVHVWTKAEIEAQKAHYRLPIFVRSNPRGLAGVAPDVNAALAQLEAIGAPRGIVVGWDMETAVDKLYIGGVYAGMLAHGYKLLIYGSDSTVFGNDVPDGLYFAADWTGVAHLAGRSVMTQWVSFANDDLDVAESSLPFWDTQAKAPVPPVRTPKAAPKPAPAPKPLTEEDEMPSGVIQAPHGQHEPHSWLTGTVSQIVLRADWQGVQEAAPVISLRIARLNGTWEDAGLITAGVNEVYTIADPATCNGCSFTREDPGTALVAWHANPVT